MKYASAAAFRDALEQRLRNESRETGVAIVRLRKRVAFERILARLAATAPDTWVLKGAFALDLRLGLRTRTTKDIDLGRSDEETTAIEHLQAAAAIDLGDFFVFAVQRTTALDDATGFHAVRYSVTAELAGRRFEQFPLDISFSEVSTLAPEILDAPGLLDFAEVPTPELPVVALEQHIAEKLHAYTGTYGPEGRKSSRVKDLVDFVLIAGSASPQAEQLHKALSAAFESRARQPLPARLPSPPAEWAIPYAEMAAELDLPTDLTTAHRTAAALVDPVLEGCTTGRWEPEQLRWQ